MHAASVLLLYSGLYHRCVRPSVRYNVVVDNQVDKLKVTAVFC